MRRALALLLSLALAAPLAWAQGPASGDAPERAVARPFARLPAAPVTLTSWEGGLAALLPDGRVMSVGRSGVRTLRRGLDSEVLLACDGRLLAIDDVGRLVVVAGADGARTGSQPVSLHATPLCLDDGTILAVDPNGAALLRLTADLAVLDRMPVDALPDAEPVQLAGGAVALLVDATQRYRHGVLGDEIEAAGIALVDPASGRVVRRFGVTGQRVIEDRRGVAWPAAGRWGVVVTVSGAGDGGALLVLAAADADDGAAAAHSETEARGPAADDGMRIVAVAAGLGREQRWRHVLGASGPHLYSVATPHLGGPLERWTLPDAGGVLVREAFDLGVTSHLLGDRALDLAQLLPRAAADAEGLDLLLLPSRDLMTLLLVACDGAGCRVAAQSDLRAPLATAPRAERGADGATAVRAATRDGQLVRIRFGPVATRDDAPSVPRDGILTDPE